MPVALTGRERLSRSIERRHPDRLPVLHCVQDGALHEFGAELYDLAARCPEDGGELTPAIRPIPHPDPADQRDGGYRRIRVDEWGVEWEEHTFGIMGHVRTYPVQGPEDLARIRLPAVPEAGSAAARDLAAATAAHQARGFYSRQGWITLFETMHALRRLDELLIDIAEDNELANALADLIVEVRLRQVHALLDAGADGIQFADDWGSQTATIISRQLWRRFFLPRYRRLIAPVRERGRHVFFHSCGHILPFLDDLAGLGVQVLWPQAASNDQEALAAALARTGMGLCWDIDRQRVMTLGSPAEVDTTIATAVARFHRPAGGLILWGELYPGYPLANVRALWEGLERWRDAPLPGERT